MRRVLKLRRLISLSSFIFFPGRKDFELGIVVQDGLYALDSPRNRMELAVGKLEDNPGGGSSQHFFELAEGGFSRRAFLPEITPEGILDGIFDLGRLESLAK